MSEAHGDPTLPLPYENNVTELWNWQPQNVNRKTILITKFSSISTKILNVLSSLSINLLFLLPPPVLLLDRHHGRVVERFPRPFDAATVLVLRIDCGTECRLGKHR